LKNAQIAQLKMVESDGVKSRDQARIELEEVGKFHQLDSMSLFKNTIIWKKIEVLCNIGRTMYSKIKPKVQYSMIGQKNSYTIFYKILNYYSSKPHKI
jgi:hypothetical protein